MDRGRVVSGDDVDQPWISLEVGAAKTSTEK